MTNLSAAVMPLHNPIIRQVDADRSQRSAATLVPGVGWLQELLRLLGVTPQATDQTVPALHVPVLRVQSDGVLLHEGARSSTLYVVRSGSFKCLRVQEDGYEQVLTFAQPGELLGCEALHAGIRQTNVIAMEVSTVYALAASELRQLQQRCPLIEEAVRQGLSRQLSRTAETAEMIVAVASEVRLARFILWLSARMAEAGQSACRLRLRMGRRDIASMLGVAHETVSRSFTTLADAGLLRVENRDVEILDLQGLRARARSTRAAQGDCGQRPAAAAQHARHGPTLASCWSRSAEPLPS